MATAEIATAVETGPSAPVVEAPFVMPEKFAGKSPTEIAKAYTELEKLHAGKKPTPPAEPPAETPAVKPAEAPADAENPYGSTVSTAMRTAGVDPKALAAEWAEKGDMSAENRSKLEATFGKEAVDNYIEGWKAKAAAPMKAVEQTISDLKALAGGDDGFKSLQDWASDNLTDAELAAYNAGVNKDADTAKTTVSWLIEKRRAVDGFDPKVVIRGAPGGATGDVFASMNELTAAMSKRDDRGRKLYGVDPAYTKAVEAKLKRSSI